MNEELTAWVVGGAALLLNAVVYVWFRRHGRGRDA
jgi:hypothetical protein